MRIALVNPNTSATATEMMVSIAEEEAAGRATIDGLTAPFGAALITEPVALAVAADAVVALTPSLRAADAVIVAAFGDPGLAELRARLTCPVTGIAEAAMAEAGAGGRRFAVVTTTRDLSGEIAATARRYGHTAFAGTWTTPGDPAALMACTDALLEALAAAARAAVEDGGAEAVVVGGGPLARAARALAGTLPVPLVEPVPAAVRLSLARLGQEKESRP